MFQRIVVGVDGGQSGRDAIRMAEALAPADAELDLVHVCLSAAAFGHEPEDALDRRTEAEGEELLRRAAADCKRPTGMTVLGAWSAASGLHRHAERCGADLDVVGAPHHSRAGRLVAGDTARSTLHGAPCAVVVVPPGRSDPRDHDLCITVGYDAGPESIAALHAADELARRAGVGMRVVMAVCPPEAFSPVSAYTFDFDEFLEDGCRRAQRELDRLTDAFGERISGEIVIGGPIEVLDAAARESDVLVVGSRGYGPLRRLVLGSTSEALVGRAPCAVMVMPRAVAAAQDPDGRRAGAVRS